MYNFCLPLPLPHTHPFYFWLRRYVASKMKEWIEKVGAKTIFLIVIDGGSDWSATEDMIQSFYPWISFMHCTSHEVSLIVKDCFDDESGIAELVELNNKVTDAQHWFSTHACKAFLTQQSVTGEKTAFV